MLWSISTVSPPLHLRHCWLACLHLRQTFCQISRFILIAPLCQRLLMIFYHTLHSAFHRCLFCFRRRRALRRLRYWSNRPSSPRELVITQSVLKLSPFSERRKGLEVCFAPKKKKKKKLIVYALSRPEHTLQKSWCKPRDSQAHWVIIQKKVFEPEQKLIEQVKNQVVEHRW